MRPYSYNCLRSRGKSGSRRLPRLPVWVGIVVVSLVLLFDAALLGVPDEWGYVWMKWVWTTFFGVRGFSLAPPRPWHMLYLLKTFVVLVIYGVSAWLGWHSQINRTGLKKNLSPIMVLTLVLLLCNYFCRWDAAAIPVLPLAFAMMGVRVLAAFWVGWTVAMLAHGQA